MARRGIEYIDVETAIEEIMLNGENVTIDRIREYLGTGSKTTINRYFKKWQLKNDLRPNSNIGALPDHLIIQLTNIYADMQKEARLELVKLKRQLELAHKQNQDLKSKLTEAR